MIELYFALSVFIALLIVLASILMDSMISRSIDEIRQALETIKEKLKKKTLNTRWGIIGESLKSSFAN